MLKYLKKIDEEILNFSKDGRREAWFGLNYFQRFVLDAQKEIYGYDDGKYLQSDDFINYLYFMVNYIKEQGFISGTNDIDSTNFNVKLK